MVDVASLVSQGWFVLLLSVILSLLVFPLVVLMSFLYDSLAKKNSKTSKISLMLACTFIGTLIVVLLLEVYFGYSLPELFSRG